jgi:hypothetical protein
MNMDLLTDDNFLLFCAKYYDNPHYDTEEFFDDVKRIKYVKKLITRYVEKGDLKERLILNHIIILNNCFGPEILCKILYLKLKDYMKYVKPFLIFLNLLTPKLYNIEKERLIYTDMIPMDTEIIARLRKV